MKFLGIDWAETFHVVALVDDGGRLLWTKKFPHTVPAIAELLECLGAEGGPAEVEVAIEPGSPLLADQLMAAGYSVYEINPRQADRYRDRHTMAGAKDDDLDAYVLADALRTDRGRLRPRTKPAPLTEGLGERDRARSRLIDSRTRAANRLHHVLLRYYPAAIELERDGADAFFLELLRVAPDPDAARALRPAVIRRLLKEHRIRVLTTEQVLERFRAPSPEGVVSHVVRACRDEVVDLVEQIQLLNRQIARADERMASDFEQHPDREIYFSLPGLGDSLAVRVAAELGGERDRLTDPTNLPSLAGTAPVTHRSGNSRGRTTMRRGCNRRLQAAMFSQARGSLATSRWARAYYEHARKSGKTHAMALRGLSNRWAGILGVLLVRGETYDEPLHIRNLVAAGVPWAKGLAAPAERAA